jgi:hypothetical protein
MDRENSTTCSPTDVSESGEVKRFRRIISSMFAMLLCMTAKLNEPSLVRMEFQAKLGHPFLQGSKALAGFVLTAKANHEVVSITNDHYGPLGFPLPPIFNP